MSSKHQNINFTAEQENIGSLSFLDVKFSVKTVNLSLVFTENQHLVEFSPMMKVLFQCTKRGDFYTHYFIGVLAYVVISRHFEIDHLKTILMKNNYPPNYIDSCIKSFFNKLYAPKVIVQNVPKRNVFLKLPFLRSTSFQIRKKLQKLFSDKLTSFNLKIVSTALLEPKA